MARPAGFEPATYDLGNRKPGSEAPGNTQVMNAGSASPAESPAHRTGAKQCEPVQERALDHELVLVTEAWPTLQEPMKAAILAMLKAAAVQVFSPPQHEATET